MMILLLSMSAPARRSAFRSFLFSLSFWCRYDTYMSLVITPTPLFYTTVFFSLQIPMQNHHVYLHLHYQLSVVNPECVGFQIWGIGPYQFAFELQGRTSTGKYFADSDKVSTALHRDHRHADRDRCWHRLTTARGLRQRGVGCLLVACRKTDDLEAFRTIILQLGFSLQMDAFVAKNMHSKFCQGSKKVFLVVVLGYEFQTRKKRYNANPGPSPQPYYPTHVTPEGPYQAHYAEPLR